MKCVQRELERLFRVTDAAAENIELVNGDGRVATLVVAVAHGGDWPAVAGLLSGIQETLGLTMPAVAVDGKAGFQVWLPLAEPVAPDTAAGFLAALRRQFLGDIADTDPALLPMQGGPNCVRRIPSLSAESGRWSAFIDPNMGGMFVDEGGLDFEPNPDRQADLLAGISRIEPADFARALAILSANEAKTATPGDGTTPAAIGGGYSEPRDFLLAVMNEPGVPLALRIEAAKALVAHGRH